ncbi:phage tail assembly chaperone [Rhodoplanes roseus]|uniref:Tail assembly chaperone n=1 Tax=Rhodoplanes roseus TaxID=29409 RepID=A0A327L4E3_9BRAD|nr:hypothetical protein [Rhodoplanes roseus]RAI44703.1 hypothetical protein CH341_07755 [Rhodoplanes roseus]
MAWGGEIEILERWLAEGRKVPPGYLDRPVLPPGAAMVWDAFTTLSSDRSVGMGEGPIPFASIDRWAVRYGIDDLDEFDRFAALVQALDGRYLAARRDEQERAREAEAALRREQKQPV